MDFDSFKQSLNDNTPPENLSVLLLALWWDGKGEWDKAHETAQDVHDLDGSWVHAYLHRKEGDESNASYWYSRANKSKSNLSLEKEWEEIVTAFLR